MKILGSSIMWIVPSLMLLIQPSSVSLGTNTHSKSASGMSTSWQTPTKSSTFAQQMLAEHNAWRQKYNVPALTWDNTLAASAQDWANQIAAGGVIPPPHRANYPYGENIFWGTGGAFTPKDVVGRWGNEENYYDRAANTCAAGKFCVHFTQLVWSTTTKVGCGKATSAGGAKDFFVCSYNPPGNYSGQSPFTSSPSTSAQSVSVIQGSNPKTVAATPKKSSRFCPNETVTRADMMMYSLRSKYGGDYTPPPATGTVFNDTNPSARKDWIEQGAKEGLAFGCEVKGSKKSDRNFCPARDVTRGEMAKWSLQIKHGRAYTPPAATGTVFADVSINLPLAGWIEQSAKEGISLRCETRNGKAFFCPETVLTRGEIAKWILLSKHGSTYHPPPATGAFADVPSDSPYAAWIEQLAKEGISSGCGGA